MSQLSAQLASALTPDQGNDPEWVSQLRRSGSERFRKHGLPSRKDEAWKYTGLGVLDQIGVELANGFEPSGSVVSAPIVEHGLQVNIQDGNMRGVHGELPSGVTVLSLPDALENGPDGLQALLESLPEPSSGQPSTDGFSALNSATLGAGVVIHIAAGSDAVCILLNWSNTAASIPRLFNSRICVMLERGTRLQLLEQFESPHEVSNTCNIVLQTNLAEGASLQHVRLQQESKAAVLITRTEVTQQAESEYSYFGFDLGGGLVRHDLHTTLLGNDAKTSLNGAYLLDGRRHVDNHAKVDHVAPNGSSEQYFRGVAGGHGKAVFNTAVCVHRGADGADALQSNANILLSAWAEIDTKPELEIYADEVVASHGATVGQLDELAVFYLRSRGLNEEQARQLLISAFCRSVSDRLDDRKLADAIAERMLSVMPQAE